MLLRKLKPYDIFISYVTEDRDVVELMYEKLIAKGFRVWYANRELVPGASIRPLINHGIENARYGVVVISPYSHSHWAHGELFALLKNEGACLPVLHKTTVEEMAQRHPEIITIMCLHTSVGIDNVVSSLTKTVKLKSNSYYRAARTIYNLRKHSKIISYAFVVLCVAALLILSIQLRQLRRPSADIIEQAINTRIENIESESRQALTEALIRYSGNFTSLHTVNTAWIQLQESSPVSYHRNKFQFGNGYENIRSLARLEDENIISTPDVPFGIKHYRICLFKNKNTGKTQLHYAIYNQETITPEITNKTATDSVYKVTVKYTNALRYADVQITIDPEADLEQRSVNLHGLKPVEVLVFQKKGNEWVLLRVD